MKKQRILSLVLVLTMVMSMLTFNITVSQASTTTVDPTDFSAFQDYGSYVYASQSEDAEVNDGLNAFSYDDTPSYDNRIYSLTDDAEQIAAAAATDNLKKAYNIATNGKFPDIEYITRSKDGAWGFKSVASKNAMWTTQNVRYDSRYSYTPATGAESNRARACQPGYIYIKPTDDVINESVTNLTFLIEYYDNSTSDITVRYLNTGFTNSGASLSDFKIDRTDTNAWKTGVYHVTNAKLDKDWTTTGLADTACMRLDSPGNDMYISKILVIPTATYNNILNPSSSDEEALAAHNDGVDWWTLAKTKGAYIEAADVDNAIGMEVYSANRLYDLNDATDLAAFGDKTLGTTEKLTAEQIKTYTGISGHTGFAYAADATGDNAMKFSQATSGNGVNKATFFTAKNLRQNINGGLNAISGNIYFRVTSNKITSSDDEVYILVEYLDKDDKMSINSSNSYVNQSVIQPTYACNDGNSSGYYNKNALVFRRHNTNTWRTVAIPLTDSELVSTNSATVKPSGLVNNTYDFRLDMKYIATHVSRVGVVKMSDVGTKPHVYYAPQASGAAPTIWLAGDSIVENLDPVTAYPREGWGMELANYFKQATTSSISATTANGIVTAEELNAGVKVINRAKGGKSTRSFLNQIDGPAGPTASDTRWSDILNGAKRGDYLFVSFCINDVNNRYMVQTNPYLVGDPGDRFSHRANIAEFKAECDKMGVNLVLLTPAINRELGTGQDAHIASIHAQAKELGVPVLDVRAYHKALVEALKAANDTSVYPIDKTKLIYNHILDTDINAEYNTGLGFEDNTHINQDGAKEICKIIVQEIQRKASSFDSMEALAAWVNPKADITTMAAPAHQTAELKYAVSDVKYIVDGQEKSDYQKGEVEVELTVTNTGAAASDAVLYVALYDGNGNLAAVAVSDAATLASGASAKLTSPAITVPDLDGYKLRKFVWNSDMVPYDTTGAAIVLTADGFNRRANLEWTLKKDLGDVTFEIYRDDLKIATTKKAGYVDEKVQRGEHLYQINAVDAKGNVVAQSAYAAVTVTNLYEVKQNTNVSYIKANIDSYGNGADLESRLTLLSGSVVVDAADAKATYGLADEQFAASKDSSGNYYQGCAFLTKGGDFSFKRMRVADSKGIEKEAWRVSKMYRPNRSAATDGHLTILQKDTSYFTEDDTKITIFVEFLANKTAPSVEYSCTEYLKIGGDTEDTSDDVYSQSRSVSASAFTGSQGDWRVARYDITDACFADGNGLASDGHYVPFRITGNTVDGTYISSIVVVKGDAAAASKVMAELNNLNFYEAEVKSASSKYPNGVSADFSTGEAVLDGIELYYSTSGTADNSADIYTADDGTGYFATRYIERNEVPWQSNLYFKIDSEYLWGGADKLVVEMTYKADHDVNLNLNMPTYNKEAGVASNGAEIRTVATLKKDLANNWQTITFEVDDANILNIDNNGCTLRLNVPVNGDDETQQLQIRDIRISNANATPVQVVNEAEGPLVCSGHTLYIAADSIAAYYSAADQASSKNPGITGWGMTIGDYLTHNITINNKAKAGASTVTFANMPSILSSVKEGDYVLISFGHNDQMSNKLVEIDDYKANLTNWINQIREKKGVPVLVTMIPQGNSSTGYLIESTSFDERRAAVAQVAAAEDVMLVKLGEQMFEDEANGVITTDDVKTMYCIENSEIQTHVVESGARYISEIIVNSMKEQSAHFAKFVK